jgi:hypothetical protein
VIPETMTTAAGADRLADLEASFLSLECTPSVQGGPVLLPRVELPQFSLAESGALDDPTMLASVRTRSTRCCFG